MSQTSANLAITHTKQRGTTDFWGAKSGLHWLGEPCVSCALLRYYHTTNFWESDPVSLKSALHYALDTLKGAPSLDEIRSFHELPYNAKKPHIMAPGSLTAKPR